MRSYGRVEVATENTAQKMKSFIKDFFSIYDQIHRKLRILSHLLNKSIMENSIFCTVKANEKQSNKWGSDWKKQEKQFSESSSHIEKECYHWVLFLTPVYITYNKYNISKSVRKSEQ